MRFYLSNEASPLSTVGFYSAGSAAANWEANNGLKRKLTTARSGTNTTSAASETNVAASYDVGLGQWISDPFLQNGTFGTSFSCTIGVLESATAADLVTKFAIYVIDAAGAFRVPISIPFFSTEWGITMAALAHTTTFAAPVNCFAGERIVMEVGYRANNVVTTSYTGTIRYGGTATTDLANADSGTLVTSRSPWVDLAVDAMFIAPTTTPQRDQFHVLA